MHQTDYFIWSTRFPARKAKIGNGHYSSPNFFVAQAAEHMDAKVSPYLAFLTENALQDLGHGTAGGHNNIQGWDRIRKVRTSTLTPRAGYPWPKSGFRRRDQAADGGLQSSHQYDITTGKNYLKDTSFMDLP